MTEELVKRLDEPIGPDKARSLRPDVRSDVEEFLEDNGRIERMEDLSPRQVLNYYLEWNGVVNYQDIIVDILVGLL